MEPIRKFINVVESAQSVEQLAHISDKALDDAYHYGRSQPGNSFGWQANLASAAYAKQAIDNGETDIMAISDANNEGEFVPLHLQPLDEFVRFEYVQSTIGSFCQDDQVEPAVQSQSDLNPAINLPDKPP